MLLAYFDDSGTDNKSEVVSWGGFIGSEEQWHAVENEWSKKLKQPLSGKSEIRNFHVSECKSLRGNFATYNRAESDLLRREFRDIIIHSGLVGIAYGVIKKSWDNLVTGINREFFGDSGRVAFRECIRGTLQKAETAFSNVSQVSIFFDCGQKNSNFERDIKTVLTNYSAPFKIAEIGFVSAIDNVRLQPADTLATEHMWAVRAEMAGTPPDSHMQHFIDNGPIEGYIMDEDAIAATLAKCRQLS